MKKQSLKMFISLLAILLFSWTGLADIHIDIDVPDRENYNSWEAYRRELITAKNNAKNLRRRMDLDKVKLLNELDAISNYYYSVIEADSNLLIIKSVIIDSLKDIRFTRKIANSTKIKLECINMIYTNRQISTLFSRYMGLSGEEYLMEFNSKLTELDNKYSGKIADVNKKIKQQQITDYNDYLSAKQPMMNEINNLKDETTILLAVLRLVPPNPSRKIPDSMRSFKGPTSRRYREGRTFFSNGNRSREMSVVPIFSQTDIRVIRAEKILGRSLTSFKRTSSQISEVRSMLTHEISIRRVSIDNIMSKISPATESSYIRERNDKLSDLNESYDTDLDKLINDYLKICLYDLAKMIASNARNCSHKLVKSFDFSNGYLSRMPNNLYINETIIINDRDSMMSITRDLSVLVTRCDQRERIFTDTIICNSTDISAYVIWFKRDLTTLNMLETSLRNVLKNIEVIRRAIITQTNNIDDTIKTIKSELNRCEREIEQEKKDKAEAAALERARLAKAKEEKIQIILWGLGLTFIFLIILNIVSGSKSR